jgi:hypothetical protein
MSATTMHPEPHATAHDRPRRGLDLPASVSITWALAGGMLLGGAGVAALQFADRMRPGLMLAAATMTFVIGALLGFGNGALLGFFGRPEAQTKTDALKSEFHGLLYLGPALLIGWLLTGWIAAMPLALHTGSAIGAVISGMAWFALLAVLYAAASTGMRALLNAYRRWPQHTAGTFVVFAVLAALLVIFLTNQPVAWFGGRRITTIGAVALAFALTFWVYGPLVTVALAVAQRSGLLRAFGGEHRVRRALASVGLAVAAGLAVTVISLPFYGAPPALPTGAERMGLWTAIGVAVAHAVSEELFVRLIVLTAAFVVASRLLPTHRHWAIGIAIAVATAADLAIHAPAIASLGLPGIAMGVAFTVVHVAIPAVLFGILYLRRGIGTAVGAHAIGDVALILLAV